MGRRRTAFALTWLAASAACFAAAFLPPVRQGAGGAAARLLDLALEHPAAAAAMAAYCLAAGGAAAAALFWERGADCEECLFAPRDAKAPASERILRGVLALCGGYVAWALFRAALTVSGAAAGGGRPP